MPSWPTDVWPVASYQGRKPVITQGFRPKGGAYNHYGVDIMFRRKSGESNKIPHGSGPFHMPLGVPAVASADGRVKWAFWAGKHGGQVGIVHKDVRGNKGLNVKTLSTGKGRVMTMYAHLYNIKVKPGQRVKKGTVLGYVGDSPTVRDPRHLHFETRYDGRGCSSCPKGQIDPKVFLKGAGLSAHSGASGIFNYLLLGGVGYGVYRLLKWRGIL